MFPFTIELEDGGLLTGATQADSFFTSTYWLFTDGDPVQFPIPPKSSPNGVSNGRLLLSLEEDWQPQGESFATGELVAFDLDAFLDTHELPPVELVFRPSVTQAVSGIAVARGATLLAITDNVVGQVLRLEPTDDGWSTTPIDLPGTGDVSIAFSDLREQIVLLNYEDFLTPTSLLELDSSTEEVATLKTLPARFDTDGLMVEQHSATSADGT